MKPQFDVKIIEYQKISSLPDSWTVQDFRSILELTDFGDDDISDNDIEEMTIMVLQDFEPEEAAMVVIKYRLGDKLNNGQRQELINEMQEEDIWEEYGDMSLHEEIFNISTVMHSAFPRIFPETEAVRVIIQVKVMNAEAQRQIENITESFICRLIADGMSEHSILYRLFDDQLLGNKFPESENIIWKYQVSSGGDGVISITIVSTDYWVKELKNADDFQSSAYNDI